MNGGVAVRAGTFALGGAIAGLVVAGVGGRVAMRIAGAMSDPAGLASPRTANGNVLGEITLGGTLALAVFSGLIPGLIAGAGYGASRPWLAPLGRWSGGAYGLLLLAAVGPAVLKPFNLDFQKFGAPALNVLLFAALFPLFGVAVAAASTAVSARARSLPWRLAGLIALAALVPTLALLLGTLVSALTGSFVPDPSVLFLLWFIFVPLVLRLVLDRTLSDARALSTRARVTSYALMLAPALVGAPATVEAMLFLAR